jgi:hypothetical protein
VIGAGDSLLNIEIFYHETLFIFVCISSTK